MKTIASYIHRLPTKTQEPDTAPGPYYVSVVDGNLFALLLGPFNSHQEALNRVEEARAKAIELNPRAHFYNFGTVRMKPNFNKPGRLNKLLGIG